MIPDVDLGIKRPDTLPLTITEKQFMVIGEVNIGTNPAFITTTTQVTMVDFCVYLLLLIFFMKLSMSMKYVIVVSMMSDVYLGLKIPATIHFTIVDKVLMVMGEVDICLRPSPYTSYNPVDIGGSFFFVCSWS